MSETDPVKTETDGTELSRLQALEIFNRQLLSVSQSADMLGGIAHVMAEQVGCSHALLLILNTDDANLEYLCAYPKPMGKPQVYVATFNVPDDSLVTKLIAGEILHLSEKSEDEYLRSLGDFIGDKAASLIPLRVEDKLIGLAALYNKSGQALDSSQKALLMTIAANLGLMVQLANKQNQLQKDKDDIERESEIFRRIDAELSDVIDLNYVFTMMKDWALRFSNADAAALLLYDSQSGALRIMSQYGFRDGVITLGDELQPEQGGITLRVARMGKAEIVSDVMIDSDYYEMAEGIRTQMSVPIKREEQVIGVLALLSRRVNGFTEKNLEFVRKLANRAGVAVDNARLFAETKREREKLSYILRNIADNVIVLGLDHRIVLINASTILAFHLSADEDYTRRMFADVIRHQKLQVAYQEAVANNEAVSTEVELPNKRIYHATIEYHQGVGRILVMRDITHFKETDRLKTELVATVSHDLKQPLSVMRGYLDLLDMVNVFDERSQGYIGNLNHAFRTMRQLIDDLLDIAKIEAGLKLEAEDVNIVEVLSRAYQNSKPLAEKKNITLIVDLPEQLPIISGDPARLEQIFNNLVGNAVKYTQTNGRVHVYTEMKQDFLRVFIEDNGMGIGAEDQAQIFERFYRVRRPETDNIEGTGLGLAIVKSLVEAHKGKIDLKSALGVGSTFRVILPISH
jgi:two-component system NtrC family sensor kinase